MRRRAVIRLSFPSEKHLKTVLKALKPETGALTSSRSRTRVEEEDGELIVRFESNDTTALRAAINAYLRWVGLAQSTLEVVDDLSTEKDDE
ncbi:MAG: hypothetical protein JSW53_03715 [Candidatus Bathyarchaeota archaeon]|nr:MAG: hypothetical protein JSW53_03715 [Candidatus Bathyarchaeota archaeon]